MASVSSLDKDLRKMRLDRYTPAAANEARTWIEDALGDKLPSSDLLEGLRDGVALCKLVNMAVPPPGIKFKQSPMPFVQMENISHFLRACQSPPLNLHQHDTFLTVDLYEQKDPAQVLQCIGAFSRAAHAVNPASFPAALGKARSGAVSPQKTGPSTPTARNRGLSLASNTSSAHGGAKPMLPSRTGDLPSGRQSPTKSPSANGPASPGQVTSWSQKQQEGSTSPAWNIAQYGYMGGASQGNLGISFGGRRQITSAGPKVPSLAEKQKLRREREAEEERLRQEAEEEAQMRRAEEERAAAEEARRWEEETNRLREEERRKAEEEKRQWEEEERQWRLTEEKRRKEEEEAEARLAEQRTRSRGNSDARLRGQFLSQYRAEQGATEDADGDPHSRVRELEKELELARQREAEYERERQGRKPRPAGDIKSRSRSRSRPAASAAAAAAAVKSPSRQDSWSKNEREVLRTSWKQHQRDQAEIPEETALSPVRSPRPLPDPGALPPVRSHNTGGRPLPDPATYTSPTSQQRAPDYFGSSGSPAPPPRSPQPPARPLPTSSADEHASPPAQQRGAERSPAGNAAPAPPPRYNNSAPANRFARGSAAAAAAAPAPAPSQKKAGGWGASKSLLEREMDLERQRQQEWEEAQKETAAAARNQESVEGVGGRWDVGQWSSFTGGDNQNRGSQGIGAGRRQIVGPRPLPGSK